MDESCHVEPIQKSVSEEDWQKVDRAFLAVWGMGCPNCAARVRNSLLSQNGVLDAFVDHTNGIAGVAYNPELVSVELLLRAVSDAGNDGRHEYGAYVLGTEMPS